MSRMIGKAETALCRKLVMAGAAAVVSVAILTIAPADAEEANPVNIVRVEEDWGLLLKDPDTGVNAPQFHTLMSPFRHTDSLYFQTTWNYWELPGFQTGGLQLQVWRGKECQYDQAFQGEQLSTTAELIYWTQRLTTNGEIVTLQINNGHSETWGDFGGETMKLHGDLHVPNLNGYSPRVSAENSWITYGSNRVSALVILRVRYYSASGLVYTDSISKIVYWNPE